jgi:hypothetical protein
VRRSAGAIAAGVLAGSARFASGLRSGVLPSIDQHMSPSGGRVAEPRRTVRRPNGVCKLRGKHEGSRRAQSCQMLKPHPHPLSQQFTLSQSGDQL